MIGTGILASLDSLRLQTETFYQLFQADLPKRLLGYLLVFTACFQTDYVAVTMVLLSGLAAAEATLFVIARRAGEATEYSKRQVYVTLALHVMQTLCGFGATFVLIEQSISGLVIFGLVWAMLSITISVIVFARLPAFFLSMALPAAGIMIATAIIGVQPVLVEPTPFQRIFPSAGIFLLLFATFAFYKTIQDTNKLLDESRIQALSRLRKLEYMSVHDELTGLQNRSAFDKHLTDLMQGEGAETASMLMIDLNGFKPINDNYGHSAGDAVLQTLATRFSALMPEGCTAYRLGGDEFSVLLEDVAPGRATQLGQRLITAAKEPVPYGDQLLTLSASIGLAYAKDAEDKPSVLCANADQAMYSAKAQRSETPVVYDPEVFGERLTLEHRLDLVNAMAKGEIRPHYQPKFALRTGEFTGMEALVRWEHPTRGLLFPHAFLDDIAQLGLMADLTPTVLRRALQDIETWLSLGLDPGRVAVNMPEVVLATASRREELDWVLAEYPRASRHLIFEITEDVFIARSAGIIQSSITHFRNLGIQISLDDFGTGYASFQHLQQLEFDEMKIDTSFVAGLGTDPVAEVIVNGFVSIANGIGVRVVAEGIEREDQRLRLTALGVHSGQGFLFGKSVPPEEVICFMPRKDDAQTG